MLIYGTFTFKSNVGPCKRYVCA